MRSQSVIFAFLGLFLVGCGTSASGPVATKGTVKSKSGRPCDNALVVFHPLEKDRLNNAKPVGKTDSKGSFVLTTFAENDGAIPGEYAITVVWPSKSVKPGKMSLTSEGEAVGADQLKGKFGNPSQPLLKATVHAKGATDLVFEVD